MLDALKPLLENELFNEEARVEIQEQWDKTLLEAKETIRTELREEFAEKYDHDKTVMVEALDKMVTSGLETEIKEFKEEKADIASDRVKFQKQMAENVAKFNNFMTIKLAEEIKELRKDRKVQMEGLGKVEKFVVKKLASEITEFADDKRELVETKVKLVAEANAKLQKLKANFIAESSKRVQAHVSSKLKSELTSLNEDIKSARENNFGRRIFEAFSSEFTTTHLNENAVIRGLKKDLNLKEKELTESAVKTAKLTTLTESKEKQIRQIKENNSRTELLDELLGPLNGDKATIMQNLLENVQTSRLQGTFEKYLPAVLNNKKVSSKRKQKLTESKKSVSGNKTAKPTADEYNNNIVDIKKLAGLK